MPESQHKLIQVDLRKVLDDKLGSKAWLVPGPLVRWLERTVRQDDLNEKLRLYYPQRGADFCEAAVADFGVSIDIEHADRLPDADHRRVIFVSNHPLGGFDGVVLIAELCRRYGKGVRFVVNDILMALDPLRDVFLPVNKHGRQSREAITQVNEAMDGPDPIAVFPAGLVSRRGLKGAIRDLQWHKMFVAKAVQYHRDVVPLFFSGQNSQFFYRLAQWRKRLRIPFNIEMLYLPSEALDCAGREFTIKVGNAIPWQTFTDGVDYLTHAQRVKEAVYELNNQQA